MSSLSIIQIGLVLIRYNDYKEMNEEQNGLIELKNKNFIHT
jgi:hypothetical protein